MKRAALLGSMAVVSVALAACSNETPGVPGAQASGSSPTAGSPTSGGPFPTGKSTSPTGTSGQKGDNRLIGLPACSLLSSGEVANLGAGTGKEEKDSDSSACVFEQGNGFAMTVTIYPALGIKDIVAKGAIKPGSLNKHETAQYLGGISSCVIAIKMSETSRVDVSSSARGDEQKACQIANQGATFVEQKLPVS